MKKLTIGKIANEAGVGVETIRFYEREGLLDKPSRRASGYRQYSQEAVERIRFIRRAKDLGFSLKEIRELLELRIEPNATKADIRNRAEEKVKEISEKIKNLQHMKRALERLVSACSGKGSVGDCPILEAMEGKTMDRKER